ncbi:MAG: aldehyde dehydrogenase family protein [Candidatus Baldrarchaeia archaeon]
MKKRLLRKANKTKYGLMAAIFTENLRKAFDIAKKLESGTVIVNDSTEWFEPHRAFGRYKWSGTKGREGGIHAIKEFSKIKTI